MRTSKLVAVLASASLIRAQCSDMCASAVTAVGAAYTNPLITRSADCAAAIATTVTPNANLTTWYTSVDMESYGWYQQTTPIPIVPTYATDCANEAAYTSACSCASVTANTVVLPTPMVYIYDDLPTCDNPNTCANNYASASCAGGQGICVGDADGGGWCVVSGGCGVPCDANTDCPSGICLTNLCCGGPTFKACYDPVNQGAAFAYNWASSKKLAKKQASGGDPSNALLGDHVAPFPGITTP